MPYTEDQLLPLSALQHLLYCERQCALTHVERQWDENRFTADGRVMHERTHDAGGGFERGVRVERAMPLWSRRLGLCGVADVVEFRNGQPMPVEYKRGRPKGHRADEVQVCAQALCLEEMLGVAIVEAALFYGEPRRRTPVWLDAPLRTLTEETARRLHALLESGVTPPPAYERGKCSACSLIGVCLPKASHRRSVAGYLDESLVACTAGPRPADAIPAGPRPANGVPAGPRPADGVPAGPRTADGIPAGPRPARGA